MREVVVAGDPAEGGGEHGVLVRASLFTFVVVVEIEAAGIVELSERALDGVGEELVEVGLVDALQAVVGRVAHEPPEEVGPRYVVHGVLLRLKRSSGMAKTYRVNTVV